MFKNKGCIYIKEQDENNYPVVEAPINYNFISFIIPEGYLIERSRTFKENLVSFVLEDIPIKSSTRRMLDFMYSRNKEYKNYYTVEFYKDIIKDFNDICLNELETTDESIVEMYFTEQFNDINIIKKHLLKIEGNGVIYERQKWK